jgi:hypothetical protein
MEEVQIKTHEETKKNMLLIVLDVFDDASNKPLDTWALYQKKAIGTSTSDMQVALDTNQCTCLVGH